ncbi:hypothetical protein [Burkholderia diffusa]|uniref:hypothetical protein n=1 Tax=Burkholderia diffusa TaxID=488732 RepID=UPI001FC8DE3B|nr:hypothetical protein [Burkholderia diffusa]
MHQVNSREVDVNSLAFQAGSHVVLRDGATLSTGDLFQVALMGSMALNGQPVRIVGLLPGVTLWVMTGALQPHDGEDPEVLLDGIWQQIRPKLIEWLTMPVSPADATMALGDYLRLQVGWDGRYHSRASAMTVEVRHDAAAVARYAKQRRRVPLVERPRSGEEDARRQRAIIRDQLVDALRRAGDTADPKLARLPGLIRYRVTGAMSAWHGLRDTVDAIVSPSLTQALQTWGLIALVRYIDQFTQDLLPDGADGYSAEQVRMLAQFSAVWLAFEVRNGVFYEPTPPLHRLLDAAYIADDVPIGMLTLPADTLCIIPEPVRWGRTGEVEAVAIFRTARALGFATWTYRKDVGSMVMMDAISLSLNDPDKTIHTLLDESFQDSVYTDDAEARSLWRHALDYAIKMLLYLNARDAQVVHDRAYSNAPRNFAGLGKRKRAERLAEIEQLYDRHVVGPAILDAESANNVPTDGPHHEVRGHWRRPHFRMQPHGPQASLRKLVFIGPTIVRPDRLGLA